MRLLADEHYILKQFDISTYFFTSLSPFVCKMGRLSVLDDFVCVCVCVWVWCVVCVWCVCVWCKQRVGCESLISFLTSVITLSGGFVSTSKERYTLFLLRHVTGLVTLMKTWFVTSLRLCHFLEARKNTTVVDSMAKRLRYAPWLTSGPRFKYWLNQASVFTTIVLLTVLTDVWHYGFQQCEDWVALVYCECVRQQVSW